MGQCVTIRIKGKCVIPEAAKWYKVQLALFFLAKDISELSSRKLLQVSVSPHYRAEI